MPIVPDIGRSVKCSTRIPRFWMRSTCASPRVPCKDPLFQQVRVLPRQAAYNDRCFLMIAPICILTSNSDRPSGVRFYRQMALPSWGPKFRGLAQSGLKSRSGNKQDQTRVEILQPLFGGTGGMAQSFRACRRISRSRRSLNSGRSGLSLS